MIPDTLGAISVSIAIMFLFLVASFKHGPIGASMTLVGLLPPLCDNGNMLVDGGYSEFSSFILEIPLMNSVFSGQPSGKSKST